MSQNALRLICILTKKHMTVRLISRKLFSYQGEPAVQTDNDLANGPSHIIYHTAPSKKHIDTGSGEGTLSLLKR